MNTFQRSEVYSIHVNHDDSMPPSDVRQTLQAAAERPLGVAIAVATDHENYPAVRYR